VFQQFFGFYPGKYPPKGPVIGYSVGQVKQLFEKSGLALPA
jgi:hypothetical protein